MNKRIEELKEAKAKLHKNKKGFTLAELLIVVAIIAVLVGISIPVFTAQLEKSREATDIANMRSAKAEAVAKYLDDGEVGNTYTHDASKGILVDTMDDVAAYGKGTAKETSTEEYMGYATGDDVTADVLTVTILENGEILEAWTPAE